MIHRKIITKIRKTIISFARFFLLVLFTLFCFQYFVSKHYNYAPPAPFTGDFIYNPYASLQGRWLQSNFHAHSIVWSGITNGHQTPAEIISHYREKMKYDVAVVSNYQKQTPYMSPDSPQYIPVYEHGYNPMKMHQLVLGSGPVTWFDFNFIPSLDNKQYLIEREKKVSPVVAIVHPSVRNAFSGKTLQKISGYDLLEVLNQFKIADVYWDSALSAGRIPWIIADDDCHDIIKPRETGECWTMVNANSDKGIDVLTALKEGSAYGVNGRNGVNDHYLKAVTVSGNTVNFFVDSIAEEIKLTGQHGVVKKTITHSDTGSYTFAADDHYIRAVIKFPSLTIYLNPLVRYDGKQAPHNVNTSTLNKGKTFLIRSLVVVIWLVGVFLIFLPKSLRRLKRLRNKNHGDV